MTEDVAKPVACAGGAGGGGFKTIIFQRLVKHKVRVVSQKKSNTELEIFRKILSFLRSNFKILSFIRDNLMPLDFII